MKEKVLKVKSLRFAVWIVNLYKYLCDVKKEFVLPKQRVRGKSLLTVNLLPLTSNHLPLTVDL